MKAGFGSAAATKPGGDFRFVPPTVETLRQSFPQLEILEFIGQGGMGAVYKARQHALDRLVALKILPPQAGNDPGFAERFTREARALARLCHPNIVAVYDFGQIGTLHYLVMEYVDGLNLRQLEEAGKFSPPEALRIIPQICDALQFAHDEGIVHRDIKPENVLLDKRGKVKIADFGLARMLGREPTTLRLTGARDIVGTPSYMAPEQVERPREVDHRADIYSLGVVFYEMLTGELPMGRFAPPSQKVHVDVRLDEVVLHALEKEPARRYQHASEIKTDVENISRAPAAPPVTTPPRRPAVDADPIQRQVKWPAIGLIATAIANWLALPIILLFAFPILSRAAHSAHQAGATDVQAPLLAFMVTPFVLCAVLLVSAIKMMRLESYRSSIAASVLALFVAPGNLIGFPAGIWSLAVLLRPETRRAFKAAEAARSGGRRRYFSGLALLWTVSLVLLAASIFGVIRAGKIARTPVVTMTPVPVKEFGPEDKPISAEVTATNGVWSVTASGTQTFKLFEVPDPQKQQCVLSYRAQMKSDDLVGRAYLEMWCRFPGQGEFFSRGLDRPMNGASNWSEFHTDFLLRSGQQPDLVWLNLVVEGKGTVEIQNVRLLAAQTR
jgi:predicted Ser/Thr protein kinase